MPSSSSSLLLATTLLALPWGVVASPASVAAQPSASAPQTAPKATRPGAAATPARPAKATRKTRPAATAGATPGKKGKPVADCDTPEAKIAATTKPVPVAADPLAATLAPCADPRPKP